MALFNFLNLCYFVFVTLNYSDKSISSLSAFMSSKIKAPGCDLLQRGNEDKVCHSGLVRLLLLTQLLTMNPATHIISILLFAYKNKLKSKIIYPVSGRAKNQTYVYLVVKMPLFIYEPKSLSQFCEPFPVPCWSQLILNCRRANCSVFSKPIVKHKH